MINIIDKLMIIVWSTSTYIYSYNKELWLWLQQISQLYHTVIPYTYINIWNKGKRSNISLNYLKMSRYTPI